MVYSNRNMKRLLILERRAEKFGGRREGSSKLNRTIIRVSWMRYSKGFIRYLLKGSTHWVFLIVYVDSSVLSPWYVVQIKCSIASHRQSVSLFKIRQRKRTLLFYIRSPIISFGAMYMGCSTHNFLP